MEYDHHINRVAEYLMHQKNNTNSQSQINEINGCIIGLLQVKMQIRAMRDALIHWKKRTLLVDEHELIDRAMKMERDI